MSRQEKLKELILRLHDNEDPEVIKQEFSENFGAVSAKEISEMEKSLINEGMEVDSIMKLCNVHASIMGKNVLQIHGLTDEHEHPGHPIQVIKNENGALRMLLIQMEDRVKENDIETLKELATKLWEIDKHYLRKENSIFSLMEKHGITAPPKVMWGVDDQIRTLIKTFRAHLQTNDIVGFDEMKYEIIEMITKEEDIMIPMVLDVFTQEEWLMIANESEEIGYTLIEPKQKWIPQSNKSFVERYKEDQEKIKKTEEMVNGVVKFETGELSYKQLLHVLNKTPLEITFIDETDTTRYFNESSHKYFPRTKSALGRHVLNCHPPKSQSIVTNLLTDFKSGKKDSETMWFQKGELFLVVTYVAVRDDDGSYLGTLEFVQEASNIRAMEGDRRKMDQQ